MNKEEIIKQLDKQNIELSEELSITKDKLNKSEYLLESKQQELERYKNIIKETIEKSRCIFEDKTINDDEAFYQLGGIIDKLENVIGDEK